MRRKTLLFVTLAFACAACLFHVRAAKVSTPETAARADGLYAPPIPSPTSSRKIDEYGDIYWRDEKQRLDNFANVIKETPEHVGYIIGYAGRVARVGDARRRIERAKRYIVSVRKIDQRNVVTLDGGHKENLTVELSLSCATRTHRWRARRLTRAKSA